MFSAESADSCERKIRVSSVDPAMLSKLWKIRSRSRKCALKSVAAAGFAVKSIVSSCVISAQIARSLDVDIVHG